MNKRPRTPRPVILPRHERGAVLMLIMLVLFVGGSTLVLTAFNSNNVSLRIDDKTTVAMQRAKEAIIAYAVLHGNHYGVSGAGPGHLFCPDFNNDGQEDSPCPVNSVGRLPVSITLPSGEVFHISDNNAGIDQQLWYAVSTEFRRDPAGILSPLESGTYTVDGAPGSAAVIIAPGDRLAAQNRPSNVVADYLESTNVAGLSFVNSNALDPENFDDRVLSISAQEIITPVAARMAETVKAQLDSYHGIFGRYPDHTDPLEFPDAMSTAPAWFGSNLWLSNTNYTQTALDEATLLFNGCNITFTVAFSTAEIGRDLLQC